jgi:hypothetical protein
MPHLKCVICRTRVDTGGRPADLDDDLCPGCGSLLQPVGGLTEVVGFRLIGFGCSPDGDDVAGAGRRVAARVGSLIAAHERLDAQARHDAEHWGDEGGTIG